VSALTLFGSAGAQSEWKPPARFSRPDIGSDEGGLWALMDREETRLRRSPFVIRDARLNTYIQGVACKLAGAHCPDIRVQIVHTPLFNASMAPNGLMQVWSGLLLRVESEAQLAAVLGHEIGHYMQRHAVEQLRDLRARSAFGQFLGLFGLVGAIGRLATLAGAFSFSQEQERDADRISIELMRGAGYDVTEAAKVWENLLLEVKARPGGDTARNPMFATHPPPAERREMLAKMAAEAAAGISGEAEWKAVFKPFVQEFLKDEIQLGQHDESLALFTRMIARDAAQPMLLFARAEIYRTRGKDNDLEMAITDYAAAATLGNEPPEVHRGLGLIYRTRKQFAESRDSFTRYLERMPEAPDAAMIKSYLEEMKS
jgi:predicted Zn-dependent protease